MAGPDPDSTSPRRDNRRAGFMTTQRHEAHNGYAKCIDPNLCTGVIAHAPLGMRQVRGGQSEYFSGNFVLLTMRWVHVVGFDGGSRRSAHRGRAAPPGPWLSLRLLPAKESEATITTMEQCLCHGAKIDA